MESGSQAEFINSGVPEKVMALFKKVAKNGEEFIEEIQLKSVIDSIFDVSFSIRTVRLLMYFVTSKYNLIIGLKDFIDIYLLLKPVNDMFNSLKEANGFITPPKALQGLVSMGTTISADVFNKFIYNFTHRGSSNAMTFVNFLECYLTIEGLKKKYKDEINKDASNDDFDKFMLTIMPYVIS